MCSCSDDSLLHDLSSLGPGSQSVPHVPVSVVETSQVHVGVDVLVVVVLLSRCHSLIETHEYRSQKPKTNVGDLRENYLITHIEVDLQGALLPWDWILIFKVCQSSHGHGVPGSHGGMVLSCFFSGLEV